MKNLRLLKRLLFAIVALLLSTTASFAHNFGVDGIYYNILPDYTVEVTFEGSSYSSYFNEYTGSVTIPSTVTYSGETYSVTSIGYSAFRGCTGLTSVTIPNSVTSIGTYAFDGTGWYNNQSNGILYLDNCCLGYKGAAPTREITLKEGTRLIGESAFNGCTGLTSVTIPNSVTSIDDYAFYVCKGLTEVTIPNSVTSIGHSAFRGCTGLTEVTIGNSISTIGADAFYGCDDILWVTCLNPMPRNISEKSFSSTTFTSAILTVPLNSSYVYAARIGWRNFQNVVEIGMPKVNLTLKFPENGTITHKENYGETVDLSFNANPGWKINNITFNEVDITAELDENGDYTIPILTNDAVLVVVFEKINSDTQIDSIYENNNIKVYARNGEVRVFGAEMQSEVAIYNSSGTLVYKGFDNTIALNNSGVYILTIEGRTFKFAL